MMTIELGTVLLVDDSAVFSDALRRMLETCCEEVITARTCAEAAEQLQKRDDIELLVTDVVLPDGTGFDLLRDERPEMPSIIVTSKPTPGGATLAHRLGALDYLPKPLALSDIVEVWERHVPTQVAAPSRRRTTAALGYALLVDPEEPLALTVAWEIGSLRPDGAFLLAEGPVEAGSELVLTLVVNRQRLPLAARVEGVVEPAWGRPGGLDVSFSDVGAGAAERIQSWIGRTA
ncbi:MAG: response regulator [bacterium]|nr:response regulator [bacterium]